MKIDDAIKHCEEVAVFCHLSGCAEDHRQLAEWLLELKHRREYELLKQELAKPYKDELIPTRWLCGACGSAVGKFWKYCQHCGTKIDWSVKNDNSN